MTRSEFFAGIEARVQDADSKLTTAIKEACMQQALKEYSRERPLKQVAEIEADGTSLLTLPEAYDAEVSRLLRLEVIEGSGDPELIAPNDYRLRRTADGDDVLLWLDNTPTDGTTCVLTYTAMHTISDTESSYTSGDDEALMDLAASHAALRLAAAYIDEENASLGTVTIERRTKVDMYRSLAKDLYASYERGMKKSHGANKGRSRMGTWQARGPII